MGRNFRTAIFFPLFLMTGSCTTQLTEICQKEWARLDTGLTRAKQSALVAKALEVGPGGRTIASLDDGGRLSAEMQVAADAREDVLSELSGQIKRAQWAQDVAAENNARALKGDLAQLVIQLVSAYGYADDNHWKRFDSQMTKITASAEQIRDKACPKSSGQQ